MIKCQNLFKSNEIQRPVHHIQLYLSDAPTHLHVACGTVVDRSTQLVCMSDIHFLISICTCQYTNTKDIGGQSASDTAHWIATFAQVQIVEPCLSFFVVHQRI